jgi:hypothetical protein
MILLILLLLIVNLLILLAVYTLSNLNKEDI